MSPAGTTEICTLAVAVVKFAASEKLAIVASGARTKLGMGFAPSRYDLALDMTRLDRVSADGRAAARLLQRVRPARQPYAAISHVASGGIPMAPAPTPAIMVASARPRRRSNQAEITRA